MRDFTTYPVEYRGGAYLVDASTGSVVFDTMYPPSRRVYFNGSREIDALVLRVREWIRNGRPIGEEND
jgi:hypothetical protein